MIKDIKYLIIPDVHGRDFWIHPVEETLDTSEAHIIYLGDYLDPYPSEWRGTEFNCQDVALDRFQQIINLKKQYPERITLLLGNHDCGYALGDDICSCRMDYRNKQKIEKLFSENQELFRLAEQFDIAGKHIVFSHAGILKGWADLIWRGEVSSPHFNVVDRLNNAWLTDDYRVLDALGDYDAYRGYGGYKYGSPVWSDIRSWTGVKEEETFGFNIVGHTKVKSPVVLDQICCLDCKKAFYLDSEGSIRDYETDNAI